MSEYIGNRYRIVKLIGRGGMADVYLAYDVILKREVAVKILKSDMADDDTALERFKREAGAVTQLSHPNIVDVYDVGDDGDKHYIVMEYIKGYTLKQLIKKRGPIPYKEAVWMMKQLAGALLEAHRNNVIHRDVKSQNVLIKDDGTIKLSDFGIALASGAMQLTHKDSVLGSVHYLAPELSRGKPATMQSDIYSLGIVFYELLTGDVPYKAENPVQVALMHIKGTIPSVRSFNPQIPQSVENIVIRSTAKNPSDRYKNIALMLQDLNECLKREHRNDPPVRSYDKKEKENNESVHISKLAKENKKGEKSGRFFSTTFLIIASLISIIALVLVLFLTGLIGNKNRFVTVPDLSNMTVQEAKDLLAQKDLEIDDSRITWILSDNIEKDHIISSNPAAHQEVEIGTKIKITVSSGLYSILENYVGRNYESARDALKQLNFNVKLLPVESDAQPGTVIEQSLPAGTKFDASQNNEITIKYALENKSVILADLIGWDIARAIEYLEENNVSYILSEEDYSFFSEEELVNSDVNRVVKTAPELGKTFEDIDDLRVVIYYYTVKED
ncbi:MAG: Stk1 family PASTA domain-containing Ser/Thr kinase [Erysipelotrichaceae bacterium]|jgi:serine/threonine-protein kinase|nr:Stk1 family PASTA domain-containing Ser/Thr kinase [Erysipelotrichaceae bacterium]